MLAKRFNISIQEKFIIKNFFYCFHVSFARENFNPEKIYEEYIGQCVRLIATSSATSFATLSV